MALDSILSMPVSTPPKTVSSKPSSSSSSTHSSFGTDNSSSSSSSTQSSSSSNSANTSDNGNATHNSGQNAASRNNGANSQTQQNRQAPSSSATSQSQQSKSTSQTPSANAASNANGAAQSNKTPAASFMQALAQSQADAQDSATATVAAAPQAVASGSKGKGKSAKDDSTDPSAASFGFLSQSLVASMAGIQQPSATAQATSSDDDATDGVSLSSGTSAQSIVSDLLQGTADELKGAGVDLDAKTEAAASATTASTADPNAAASSFQAHMGVSSHFQTASTQSAADTKVNTPVGAQGFAEEVGDKITWMSHQGIQSASLQMTPEHMGPVEIRISVQDGSASVAFNAANAETRAALEQALPKLHEMFSTQGLTLTDASVSQQFQRGGQQQKQAVAGVGSVGGSGGVSDETTSSVVSVSSTRLGLVDTYA